MKTDFEVVERKARVRRNRAKPARIRKKRAKTKADLKREWLIPANTPLRYVGLRGIYWYWLSRDVRKKEWEKWGGICLTCLAPITSWQEGQCGHIVPSNWCGEYLRLNRINLTIQHAGCNNPRFCPQAGVLNSINIDKRMGDGHMEYLLSLRKTECKEPSAEEYKALIRSLDSYQQALVDNGL